MDSDFFDFLNNKVSISMFYYYFEAKLTKLISQKKSLYQHFSLKNSNNGNKLISLYVKNYCILTIFF